MSHAIFLLVINWESINLWFVLTEITGFNTHTFFQTLVFINIPKEEQNIFCIMCKRFSLPIYDNSPWFLHLHFSHLLCYLFFFFHIIQPIRRAGLNQSTFSFKQHSFLNVCRCEKNLSWVLRIVKSFHLCFFFSSLYNRKGKRSLEIVRYYRCSHVLLH